MRYYNNIITINKNNRGIWDLDVSKGCSSGMAYHENGCYGECYAAKTAKIYGIDFSKTVLRDFKNLKHQRQIVAMINKIDMPFIRIGCSGDPSENWDHTLSILDKIKTCNKEIVIITKHWNILTNKQLIELGKYNVCVNTSVSAIDTKEQLDKCINQYNILKKFCKSFLRIVSIDFNTDTIEGLSYSIIQNSLFKNENIIDTVFRPSPKNKLVIDGIIKIKKAKFLKSMQWVSKFNKKTYLGNCNNCIEKCGVFNNKLRTKEIYKQVKIF